MMMNHSSVGAAYDWSAHRCGNCDIIFSGIQSWISDSWV